MSFWDGTRWVDDRPTRSIRHPRHPVERLGSAVVTIIAIAGLLLPLVPFASTQAAGPVLTLSPLSAPAGTKVGVTGSQFPVRTKIQLDWDSSATGMPTASVNGNGRFSTTFIVPKSATGTHSLSAVSVVTQKGGKTALIATVLATASFTVAAIAPSPTLSATATPSPTAAATPTPAPTATPTAAPTGTLPPTPTPAPTPTVAPTVQPTATPAPSASPASSATPAVPTSFVTNCGTYLCLGGSRWRLYAGSDLGGLDDADARSAIAVAGGLNTIRVVNFLDEGGVPSTAAYDPWHWQRVDKAIASARANGLHVLLDLSTYRNLLWNAGLNPYVVDWQPFLQFVAQRTNSITGVRYASDPTIALIAFAGEVEPVNSTSNARGVTTAQVTSFFERSFAEWKAMDANHLVSPGGFLQIDWNSGIDWKTIFALSDNDVCSIHDYSNADRTITTPAVSAYCGSIARPWITEEFGWEQSVGDSTRASLFQSMFDTQTAYHSAGVGFWNLGTQLGGTTYDVNSSTSLTWSVVRANAP
jgi:Cellulase (glycosyl hydrolase family 5)